MSEQPVRADSVPVQPAATVMLVRDGDDGVEVFMLQRSHRSSFARGQYVFPGGRVDTDDAAQSYEPIADGVTDASVSARLGIESGGLAWLVAAIRECFEEAGVLLARPSESDDIVALDDDAMAERYELARHQVHDGDLRLEDFCRTESLELLTDRILLVDHWVTPIGERRRFDTRFFVARAPLDQRPLHDDRETIASLWTTPAAALEAWRAGELQMFPPTVVSLEWLDQFDSADAVMAAAAKIGVPPPILPKLLVNDDNEVTGILRAGDDGYDTAPNPEFLVGAFRNKPESPDS